jgi:transposase
MKCTHISKLIRKLIVFKGFKLTQLFLTEKELRVSLKKTRKTGICLHCSKRCTTIEEVQERTVRDLNCFEKRTYVTFQQYKIRCKCGYRGLEKLEFIDRYSFQTMRLEEYVFLLCQKMTIKDVSGLLGISWATAKHIDKKYLRKQIVPLSELTPKRIGIDEIAYEKGHKYLTVVRDIDLNKVIWTGKARLKETLLGFFRELGLGKCKNIELAVMDMWDPFISAVKECCPQAAIVFDKFHISKKVNEAVDSIRKKEFAKQEPEKRKEMKHKRFIILSRHKNLDEKKDIEFIGNLKNLNENLYNAYLLKEQILDIFDEMDVSQALKRFDTCFSNILQVGFSEFLSVLKMLKHYWYGIVNYFRFRVTNAQSEGFNNKINIIKRRAYGFRDLEYFQLKILYSCGWKSPQSR